MVDLGPVLHSFDPTPGRWRGPLRLAAYLAVFGLAAGALPWWRHEGQAAVIWLAVLVGGGSLAGAAAIVVRTARRRLPTLWVHERGIAWGGTSVPWRQVVDLTQRRGLHPFSSLDRWELSFRLRDRPPLRIDATAYPDPEGLVAAIVGELWKERREAVQADLAAGEVVALGPIHLFEEGVAVGDVAIPWSEVVGCDANPVTGRLRLSTRAGRLESDLPFHAVPDAWLLDVLGRAPDPLAEPGAVANLARSRQSLPLGLAAGAAAALATAGLWGALVGITGLSDELDWVPMLGVGYLVGVAVRVAGRGTDRRFGFAAAAFAVLGSLAGNALALSVAAAWQSGVGNFAWLGSTRLLREDVGLGDLLGFGGTAAEAYALGWFGPSALRQALLTLRERKQPPGTWLLLVLAFPALLLLTWASVSRWSVVDLERSPTGETMAVTRRSVDGGGRVDLLEVTSGRWLGSVGAAQTITGGTTDAVHAARFLGDALVVAGVGQEPSPDGPGLTTYATLARWEPGATSPLGRLPRRLRALVAVPGGVLAIDRDGHGLKVDESGSIVEWALPTGVVGAAGGSRVAVGTVDGHVRLFGPDQDWRAHPGPVTALAWHPDGYLATATPLDGEAAVWDPATGERDVVDTGMTWVTSVAFSPDGSRLAVAGGSLAGPGRVLVLGWPDLELERELEVGTNTAACVSFVAEGLVVGEGRPASLADYASEARLRRWTASGWSTIALPE